MKGHLSPWLFVECGRYGCKTMLNLSHVAVRPNALIELRRRGWIHTDLYGFVCPECAEKETTHA